MSEEKKENWVCSGFDLIPPEERVRGCGRGSRGGQWHFGRLYGPNLIGNYDRRIPVLVWTICRCAGVRLFGREDNYLYENDILQNSDGILYAVLRRNSEFVLLNISEESDNFAAACNLKTHVSYLESPESRFELVGNTFSNHEFHLATQEAVKLLEERERVEEILDTLIPKTISQDPVPGFWEEVCEKQGVDVEKFNQILGDVLPYLAKTLVDAGYTRKK